MRVLVLAYALFATACSHPACEGPPATCRMTCSYGAGDLPSVTLSDQPLNIPIDTIVIVMQENRTFDHYYSSLTVPGQEVDGAAPDATQPDPQHPGMTVSRFHQTALCFDNPAESWDEVHKEIDGGKMDGFAAENAADDQSNDPQGLRSLGYYTEADLPFYYALSRTFAISDRHFCSVQTNSWTNRLYLMAGTSYGVTTNTSPRQTDASGNELPNLMTRLNDAKLSWMFYAQDLPSLGILSTTSSRNGDHATGFDQFFTDAANGVLPHVVFVEGSDLLGGKSPDEDPPADFQVGEAMVASIVNAVLTSPQWPHAALFITYDEQGGFYDHVPPQPACAPDDTPPDVGSNGVQAGFDETGLRVPLIVVSPYARRGYVSHVVTDHTSITRFIEARFGLPALTHRDANAVPPFDMFDFAHPDTSIPQLPQVTVDQSQVDSCYIKYPL